MYMEIAAALLLGYVLGSIPFALVIGKVFYKTDIRNYGSKNLGGGNAGRVLGKKAGVSVMALDLLKVTLAIFICSHFKNSDTAMVAAGLAAAVGHCFPLSHGCSRACGGGGSLLSTVCRVQRRKSSRLDVWLFVWDGAVWALWPGDLLPTAGYISDRPVSGQDHCSCKHLFRSCDHCV